MHKLESRAGACKGLELSELVGPGHKMLICYLRAAINRPEMEMGRDFQWLYVQHKHIVAVHLYQRFIAFNRLVRCRVFDTYTNQAICTPFHKQFHACKIKQACPGLALQIIAFALA